MRDAGESRAGRFNAPHGTTRRRSPARATAASTGPPVPPIAADLLTAGFAARLTGGPTVQAWEAKLAVYGTEYMSLGAADIQRRVAASAPSSPPSSSSSTTGAGDRSRPVR
ncbi:hypothetical protein OG594_44340 [Streptomyces sp. NBC_01214]|uniref:hypothetical protein n=1 Tax=Streptomyces sp. NBC_01214 TaxID=2903777 RepID=UPI002252647D|nr:hypothetical protein [Streptomyces sp. NBC_01214]MCX4808538.1 hypothetical protein [Streptomyces sp. NBC_01214]